MAFLMLGEAPHLGGAAANAGARATESWGAVA
jgi:hypothetical protein